jgi:hypothetical protein
VRKLVIFTLLFSGTSMLAQSAFDGTWRMNTKDAQFHSTEKMMLKDGMYNCYTCDPPVKDFKADGQSHPTTASPYYDSVTVRVINDHSVEFIATKNGKPEGNGKVTVADDNKTATSEDTFYSANGQQNHETDLLKRVEDGPPGSNKISGTWQQEKIENASEGITTITYTAAKDGLSMHDGQGDSYQAKFDGKDYPYRGDPGTTSVSLKKLDANTVEETDKRNGKVITIARMSVDPGGKTMKVAVEDKIHDSTMNFTATKE